MTVVLVAYGAYRCGRGLAPGAAAAAARAAGGWRQRWAAAKPVLAGLAVIAVMAWWAMPARGSVAGDFCVAWEGGGGWPNDPVRCVDWDWAAMRRAHRYTDAERHAIGVRVLVGLTLPFLIGWGEGWRRPTPTPSPPPAA